MGKHHSYVRWLPWEEAFIRENGPHFTTRRLHLHLPRHSLQAIDSKLSGLKITREPMAVASARREGQAGRSIRYWKCSDCGSHRLERIHDRPLPGDCITPRMP